MRARTPREGGFTLIEVMFAAAVLIVGVLGMLSLIDTASDRTAATRAREGATSLAREVAEAARQVPFARVSSGTLRDRLRERPALAGTLDAGVWSVERRGRRYEVAVDVCSIDDAGDGLGAQGAQFCAGGPAAGSADRHAEDHKRVTVRVAWTVRGRRHETAQTTLLTAGSRDEAPSLRAFNLTSPAASPITSATTTRASFFVRASAPASAVQWSIDGRARGLASGADDTFTFDWPLPDVDGAYDVGAQAFSSSGAPGVVRSLTVVLNRFAPYAVRSFNAGVNGTAIVEAEWEPARERDLIGYRVYRQRDTGAAAVACPLTTETWCIDSSAPTTGTLRYWAVGVDRDDRGREREGAASAQVTIDRTNRPPLPPLRLRGTVNGDGTVTLVWDLPNNPDPDQGDTIDSFRIYRDGTAVANRYDRTETGTVTTWTDRATGGTSHTYYVRSVDTHLRESTIEGPVP